MLLAVIAEGGKNEGMLLSHFEIEEIYRYCRFPYKRERIPASLKSLMDSDILESVLDNVRESASDGIRFRIPVGLIRRWLRKEKPLELVMREEINV